MKTKLIDLLGLTNMANDIRDWVNAHFQRKVDGKGLSTNDYDNTAKAKVDAIPTNPQYTDTQYTAGEGINIDSNHVISATGGGGGSADAVLYTEQTLTSEQKQQARTNIGAGTSNFSGNYNDLSNKPNIPTVPTNVSDFNNDAGYLTSHQDISGKEDTSNKKNDIAANRTSETYYPSTKGVFDALGKWGVISQTQTWSYSNAAGYDYTMSDLVYGMIPQANIDLFVSAGATFNATTGYFELNGLTDISYEEMEKIYTISIDNLSIRYDRQYQYYGKKDIRTVFPFYLNNYGGITQNWSSIFGGGNKIEVIDATYDVKFINK